MYYITPAYCSAGEPFSKQPGMLFTTNRKWLWQKYLEVEDDPDQRFRVVSGGLV